MTKRVYLYAFNEMGRVVGCRFLEGEKCTVLNILQTGLRMRDGDPERVDVYAVLNRPGLYSDFAESVRSTDFVKHIEFADLIAREGLKI